MAVQKIYKIAKQIGATVLNEYCGMEALPDISAEIFGLAGADPKSFTVSVIQIDTEKVNLTEFFKAKGIVVGMGELK